MENLRTKRFRKQDFIFLFILICIMAVFACYYFIFMNKSKGKVIITVNKEEFGTYSISEDNEIEIKANNKTTNILKIENKTAYMKWANCKDKRCVHQKEIKFTNEMIVCLPNKVVVIMKDSYEK